jgi:hypothetical protein
MEKIRETQAHIFWLILSSSFVYELGGIVIFCFYFFPIFFLICKYIEPPEVYFFEYFTPMFGAAFVYYIAVSGIEIFCNFFL